MPPNPVHDTDALLLFCVMPPPAHCGILIPPSYHNPASECFYAALSSQIKSVKSAASAGPLCDPRGLKGPAVEQVCTS